MPSHPDKYWLLVLLFLLASLAAGSIILVVKQNSHKPVEIVLSPTTPLQYKGEVYIGGAVSNPGFYPLREGDTLDALVQAAGAMPDADLNRIKIYVPKAGENYQPQKININRADVWLLDALPGIGTDKAQAIINYRNQQGPFKRVEDLLKVEGISHSTLEKIRGLITLED